LREDFSTLRIEASGFYEFGERPRTIGKPASPTTVHTMNLWRGTIASSPRSNCHLTLKTPPNRNYQDSVVRFGQYNHFMAHLYIYKWSKISEKRPMAEGRFVAYYRVSTEKQGRSGLGLEAQRGAVEAFLNGGSWKLVAEFTEIESGKRADRPKLAEAVKAAKKHKATLVIAKLDRLSRNVAFIANLMEAGVDFVAVDMPHANKLTIHILSAVAEHEREMISQRTRAALAAAKSRGVRLGNRSNIKVAQDRSRAARMAQADQFASNILPVVLQIRAAGVKTLNGIAEALNARGLRTPRGGEWQAVQVKRIIERHCAAA
jgi:DNA invertase Pin-like site-specific DNA recombinase